MNTTTNAPEALTDRELMSTITQLRCDLGAAIMPNPSRIAKRAGVAESKVARLLADWYKAGQLVFSDSEGNRSGHTHIRFEGIAYPRTKGAA